jgi:diguanylate cyclase (GGDEF)-like protein
MKIEISDSLFEQYQRLVKERFTSGSVAERIERFVELELRKFCVPGYERDGLTGVKSRFQLEQDVNRALWGEGWNDISVLHNRYLCLDIDDFKSYVDIHGLTKGDEVLVEIARDLGENYPGANIYRAGGDEFVVELGGVSFNPLRLNHAVTLKYSIVNVMVQRNTRRHHALRVIVFYLDKGIVEASERVTNIACKYPDIV